jgi:hypothetical protein
MVEFYAVSLSILLSSVQFTMVFGIIPHEYSTLAEVVPGDGSNVEWWVVGRLLIQMWISAFLVEM